MKISIIGVGNVGAAAAIFLLEDKLAEELVLVDVEEGIVKGKTLDILHTYPLRDYTPNIIGETDISSINNSHLIIVTAGIPRKKGMSRLDLLKVNEKIMKDICKKIKELAPEAIVIIVSNPLDVMCYLAKRVTNFDRSKIFGMAGVLDTARFKYFIAKELNIPVFNIDTIVLGAHGDEMVPVISHTKIKNKPITELLSKEKLNELINKTKYAGGEIAAYFKTFTAYYAPAASICEMVRCIVRDEKKILPVSAYLQGEYNLEDLFLGVPVKLGREGIEEIIELELTDEELTELRNSAKVIKEAISELDLTTI